MGNEPQTLTEMPLWVLILLAALGGVSGEMWRADKAGLGGWALLRRLALRSGASIVCGRAAVRRGAGQPDRRGRRGDRRRSLRTLGRPAPGGLRAARGTVGRPWPALKLIEGVNHA